MTLVASNVTVRVGDEYRTIDIYVNMSGSLVLQGIGGVFYEMLDEELYFSPSN